MDIEIKNYVVGERIVGKVIDVEKDVIYLDIQSSSDAKIDKQHFSYEPVSDFTSFIKVGDELEAMITFISDEQILLSRLPFEKEKYMQILKEKMANEETIEITFPKYNKGGLESKGIFTYFMPNSQFGEKDTKAEDYVNKKLTVAILDIDEKRGQIIVSERKIRNAQKAAAFEKSWKDIVLDSIISVKITNIVPAGLQVMYQDAVRGFIPRNALSYLPIKQLEEKFTINQLIEVKIIEVKESNHQFIASYKALQMSPWDTFSQEYKEGQVVSGKIKRISDIGAFVEIIPGVEGLLHISEVSYDSYTQVRDLLELDKLYDMKIIQIQPEKKRISLSIKRLEADPWDTLWERYHIGDILSLPVKKIERRHLWVNVEQYVDAILYKTESLLEANQDLADHYKIGDIIEVKVTDLNPKRRKIVVSQAAIIRDEELAQLEAYRKRVAEEQPKEEGTLKGKFSSFVKDGM